MKKLLVLVLVLAMTSLANAGLVLSVDGVPDPPETEIYLAPSDTVEIDIHASGMSVGTELGYIIVSYTASPGTLDATNAKGWEASGAYNITGDRLTTLLAYVRAYGFPDAQDILDFELKDLTEPYSAPDGEVVWDMIFHCDGYDIGDPDVVLSLVGADLAAQILYDEQVIHQPEPMTIALLGLGGLFLRRRR